MDLLDTLLAHPLLACAALAAVIALYGMIRDQRQIRRANLDQVSLVSWGLVSSAALIVAIVCLAIGLRAGL
jgi:uncharacterized membrane protein YidH (DUF202 family)